MPALRRGWILAASTLACALGGPPHPATVTFRYAGVVHTYCSIHESMNGTIFVSPSPYFTVVGGSGEFAWRSVPAGSWRLRSWCERLSGETREVQVLAGQTVEADLSIGDAAP